MHSLGSLVDSCVLHFRNHRLYGPKTQGAWQLKHYKFVGFAGVLIVIGAYSYYETNLFGDKAAKVKVVTAPAIPVTVVKAVTSDVPEYLLGVGVAQALKTVVIRSRIDGEMTEVDFTEGQEVEEGAVLAKLDSRQIAAQIKQTEANLAKDQTAIDQSSRDVARAQELVGKGAGPQLNLDNAKTALEAAKAALAGDQALLENQRVQLTWYTLTAPISGRTGVRRVDPGNIIHATDAAGLVTLTQMKPAALIFSLPQDALSQVTSAMKMGQLDVVAYDRDGTTKLGTGKLQLIDNQIDQSSGTMSLKAILPNEEERLWPGEFVSVKLILGMRKGVITVPATAAQRGQSGYFIFVVKPDNTVDRRGVEIADIRDDIAIVKNGLASGEAVVVDGQYKLRSGQRISVRSPTKPKEKGAEGKETVNRTNADKATSSNNLTVAQ